MACCLCPLFFDVNDAIESLDDILMLLSPTVSLDKWGKRFRELRICFYALINSGWSTSWNFFISSFFFFHFTMTLSRTFKEMHCWYGSTGLTYLRKSFFASPGIKAFSLWSELSPFHLLQPGLHFLVLLNSKLHILSYITSQSSLTHHLH